MGEAWPLLVLEEAALRAELSALCSRPAGTPRCAAALLVDVGALAAARHRAAGGLPPVLEPSAAAATARRRGDLLLRRRLGIAHGKSIRLSTAFQHRQAFPFFWRVWLPTLVAGRFPCLQGRVYQTRQVGFAFLCRELASRLCREGFPLNEGRALC
jgi:hypothetical protein